MKDIGQQSHRRKWDKDEYERRARDREDDEKEKSKEKKKDEKKRGMYKCSCSPLILGSLVALGYLKIRLLFLSDCPFTRRIINPLLGPSTDHHKRRRAIGRNSGFIFAYRLRTLLQASRSAR